MKKLREAGGPETTALPVLLAPSDLTQLAQAALFFMRKLFLTPMASILRQPVLALTRPLMSTQTGTPADGWGYFERLELALYRELAFQLYFFDEEIVAFPRFGASSPGSGRPQPLPPVLRQRPFAGHR